MMLIYPAELSEAYTRPASGLSTPAYASSTGPDVFNRFFKHPVPTRQLPILRARRCLRRQVPALIESPYTCARVRRQEVVPHVRFDSHPFYM